MTKHLINYCPIDWYEDELKRKGMTLAGLVQQLGVDGIEQFVYREPGAFPDYKELTIGAHLNYWPYWMDFWLRKAKRLQQQFRSIHERQTYFKTAMSCDEWLAVIRRNICAAISQKPEYLVWHVAEADTETIFTFDSIMMTVRYWLLRQMFLMLWQMRFLPMLRCCLRICGGPVCA